MNMTAKYIKIKKLEKELEIYKAAIDMLDEDMKYYILELIRRIRYNYDILEKKII